MLRIFSIMAVRCGWTGTGGGGTPSVIGGCFRERWRVLRASSSRTRRGSEEEVVEQSLVVLSMVMGRRRKVSRG